jgi:hypothetical protein
VAELGWCGRWISTSGGGGTQGRVRVWGLGGVIIGGLEEVLGGGTGDGVEVVLPQPRATGGARGGGAGQRGGSQGGGDRHRRKTPRREEADTKGRRRGGRRSAGGRRMK